MHRLIAAPFLGDRLVLNPSIGKGLKIPPLKFAELHHRAAHDDAAPDWLTYAVAQHWGMDLVGRRLREAVLVRDESSYGYVRASYEINKGCDYDCPHCYLGQKKFEGISADKKLRLLEIMRDAGVVWLQITGGEPLIDRHFPLVYQAAQ